MSGKWISDNQIRLYMQSLQKGNSQKVAAAQAGFSDRSARNIQQRSFEPANSKKRWKTRTDPFEKVWETELVPLLIAEPKLEARTLLEHLQRIYVDQYPDKQLRTLQRKVKNWKTVSGPEKEIIFRQNHPPGWQGISDFTNADQLGITIRGEEFPHLLYHFRLSFSGREYTQVIMGGESFSALAEGMQNAFWDIGGVPETHRTDSLSAAYKNFSDKAKEEFTEAYAQLCAHYGTEPTRNNKGISHENGSIESPNGHLKNRIDQALMLRGSRDFDSVNEYRDFVREIDLRTNRRLDKTFAEERAFLKPLPERKTCDYTVERARVCSSGTITIKQIPYSVPSRLIGALVNVHLYDDRLECYVGGAHIVTRPRMRRNKKRVYSIDYRHVIGSLVQKPQAFRNYIYREAMFPTFAFKQTWEQLDKDLDRHQSCREYVKILNQAAQPHCEEKVNDYLEKCLACGSLPTSDGAKALFKKSVINIPELKNTTSQLSDYDILLACEQGGVL